MRRETVGWQLVELDPAAGTVAYLRPDVRIDLGGVAKGHGVDRVAGFLTASGVENALVDLSGNMVALGAAPGRRGWLVGIRDPQDRVAYLATLLLQDEAVATSGDYEQFVTDGGKRYGHILDPRTGWPAAGLASVTVVAGTAATADAWATALFVLGPEEARRVASGREDLHAVLLEAATDGPATLWVETPLERRLSVVSAFAGAVVVTPF